MKKSALPLIVGLGAAGFLSGFAGKRLTGNPPVSTSEKASERVADDRDSAENSPAPPSSATAKPAKPSSLRSTDTLESLAKLDHESLYSHLALWMIDASEQDIAAYWATVRDKKDRTNDVTDLVFINWTRLNPRGAIAAVAGTSNEHYAWWAWGCHDPQGALAAAITANPDRVNNVAWGIGEFHGDWLRKNFDRIRESAKGNALSGLGKWDDTNEPEEILEFLKTNGNRFNPGIFGTLIRKDPWAAYDWIQKNGSTITNQYGSTNVAMDMLVKSMGENQPDALQRLAEQTPSGEARRKMEATLFENLLKTDPDAALEQATSTQAPRIAAERLAAVGLSLAQSDPDKTLELTQKLFAIYPDALSGMTWVKIPGGSSGSGSNIKAVQELVDGLMSKDPAKVLEMVPPATEGSGSGDGAFSTLAGKWANQDLVAYTEWVNRQSDPKIRDQAASVVVDQLTNQKQFLEATEWAMSSEKTKTHVVNIIYQWSRTNPDDARAWLDSADLPDSQKGSIRDVLQNNPFEIK
ncbi:MAG: hypothetical protein V4819_18910 [Verrucomicrobiota bacterium]